MKILRELASSSNLLATRLVRHLDCSSRRAAASISSIPFNAANTSSFMNTIIPGKLWWKNCCRQVHMAAGSGPADHQQQELPRKPPPPWLKRIRHDELAGRWNWKTVPNLLCAIRIATTPLLGWVVVQEMYLPACILFSLAALTDMLDGLIARQFPSQRSLLGSIMDPLADKFLISTLFVTLTYMHLIPVLVTGLVLSRDVFLVVGGFVLRYRMLEPPMTIRRFFDLRVSPVRVVPTKISKLNTALQLALVSTSLASPVFGFVDHPALLVLQISTACTTVYSGLSYAFHNGMLRVKKRRRSH